MRVYPFVETPPGNPMFRDGCEGTTDVRAGASFGALSIINFVRNMHSRGARCSIADKGGAP